MQAEKQQAKPSTPAAKLTKLTPAEAARESGNAAFKKGDLQKVRATQSALAEASAASVGLAAGRPYVTQVS